jgi:deoxyhypusine synthase
MAATTGEIGLSQSSAMIAIVPQLVSVAAKIALADQYHFLKKSDVDPSELDIVEESLNRLYDVLVDCEDESMVMIHKLLYDFIDKLRKDSQHAQGGEQLDYSHGNDVNDLGVEIGDSKQAPSEVSQGSGGGQSHVN